MTNQARRGFFLVVLFLTSFLSQRVYAQGKIEVASFNRMETDITARVTAPKRDQNGEVCALIRIVTTVKGRNLALCTSRRSPYFYYA